MTRDKAIGILADWTACRDASGLITAFERLGMLKLDEPKSESQKVAVFIEYRLGTHFGPQFMADLAGAGLKIVEK